MTPAPHLVSRRTWQHFRGVAVLTVAPALSLACGRGSTNEAGREQPALLPDTMGRGDYVAFAQRATQRKIRIKGWSDSQPLAVLARDASARSSEAAVARAPVLAYGPGAKIVPVDYLEQIPDEAFDRWQTLAFIYAENAYPKLGIPRVDSGRVYITPRPYNSGETEPVALQIRRTGGAADSGWQARIVYPPARYASKIMRVDRERHSAADGPVPGTARWIFTRNDETGWIACGMGCCTVGAYEAQ